MTESNLLVITRIDLAALGPKVEVALFSECVEM